jgi:hypothetical protein
MKSIDLEADPWISWSCFMVDLCESGSVWFEKVDLELFFIDLELLELFQTCSKYLELIGHQNISKKHPTFGFRRIGKISKKKLANS